jgi:hypothetical protein
MPVPKTVRGRHFLFSTTQMTRFCIFCSRWSPAAEKSLWGAHAPHVLANAPARWRTCSTCFSLNSQPSTINFLQRGHSSVGRAPALQAGSQGFESPCLQSLKGVEAKSNKKGNIVGCASGSVIPLPPAPKAFGAVAPCATIRWQLAVISPPFRLTPLPASSPKRLPARYPV